MKLKSIPEAMKDIKSAGCLVAIGLLLVFVVASVVEYFVTNNSGPVEPPDGRYIIMTSSRTFYTNDIETVKGGYKLVGYWDTQKGRWRYHREVIPLQESAWGKITVKETVKK